MGHLLFLLGSLDTKRLINKKSYELMLLSSKLRSIQSNISVMKELQANAENATASAFNTSASVAQSVFNAKVNGVNNSDDMKKLLADLVSDDPETKKAAIEKSTAFQKDVNASTQEANLIYQASLSGLTAAKQAVNSVFEAQNKLELEVLNNEETHIEMQKESLEAELEELRQEYQNDKKARQDAAKDIAPTFGLG